MVLVYDDIVKRLEALGYTVEAADDWAINYSIEKATNTIKNACNVAAVPEGLHYVAVDMVCGEFLQMKKGTGQLEGFDVEAAVKQLKEGDTAITYAIPDNSITLDGLIGYLIASGRSQFTTFRRLAW